MKKPPSFNFIFRQNDKSTWPRIKANLLVKITEFVNRSKKDWQVEIRPYSAKRSGEQLRAYWRLIKVIRCYMNDDCGNDFTDAEVSDWIKIQVGHCKSKKMLMHDGDGFPVLDDEEMPVYETIKLPKSIANKSTTTVEEMRKILSFILNFGIEHNLSDCFISKSDEDEILNNYR